MTDSFLKRRIIEQEEYIDTLRRRPMTSERRAELIKSAEGVLEALEERKRKRAIVALVGYIWISLFLLVLALYVIDFVFRLTHYILGPSEIITTAAHCFAVLFGVLLFSAGIKAWREEI